MQVLESIAPPYTTEFVLLFLPMVENEEITGTMRADGDNDLVSDFIGIDIVQYHQIFHLANIVISLIDCFFFSPSLF